MSEFLIALEDSRSKGNTLVDPAQKLKNIKREK